MQKKNPYGNKDKYIFKLRQIMFQLSLKDKVMCFYNQKYKKKISSKYLHDSWLQRP